MQVVDQYIEVCGVFYPLYEINEIDEQEMYSEDLREYDNGCYFDELAAYFDEIANGENHF